MVNYLLKKTVYCFLPILLFGFSFAQHTIASGKQKYSNSLIPNSDSEQLDSQSSKGSGIAFTPNKGQIADMDGKLCPDVLYKSDGAGADIYLRKTGISYVYTDMPQVMHKVGEQVEDLIKEKIITEAEEQKKKDELLQKEKIRIHRVDMEFLNCNKSISTIDENELDGYNNYYYAHCPDGITNVKQYNKVTYENIYNGIDISYYASTPLNASGDKQSGLKYDLIVKPHADPNQIKLHWKGAESIRINREGNLIVKTSVNEFQESIPKVYQIINGKIVDVKAKYVLNETTANFELGTWNHEHPLIIDPWATYYGGSGAEYSKGIRTDNLGNVLITGTTASSDFPILTGGYTQAYSGGDAFMVKFDGAGTRLWATFYGGTASDGGGGIDTDNANNVVITGATNSVNFPVSGGFQMSNGGLSDAFVVKFSSTGTRLWATYYGGSSSDDGVGIATDNADNIVFTGNTQSTNFPTGKTGANILFQSFYGGPGSDVFVVKLDLSGARQWGTYCGGSGADYGYGIAADNANNIVITGNTWSANFPVLGGFQMTNGGAYDAFVLKFNSSGARLWGSFCGGNNFEYGYGITTDNLNNVIITGMSYSSNFPTGACCGNFVQQAVLVGGLDAFLVKYDQNGARQWSTVYGGPTTGEGGYGVVSDNKNNIYLLMEAEDAVTPTLVDLCTWQPIFNGGLSTNPNGGSSYAEDQIITKFAPNGKKICATYMGGTGEDDLDYGAGISIFNNSLYITGHTDGGYPVTPGAFQTAFGGPFTGWIYGGRSDAFVAQLCTNICEGKILGLDFTASTNNVCPNIPIRFTPTIAYSCDTSGYKYSWTFSGGNPANSDSVSPTVRYPSPGSYDVKLVVTTICKKDSITKPSYITINNCACTLTGQYTKGTANCIGCGCKEWIMVTATGGTSPYSYSWPDGYVNRYKNQLCPGSYTIKVVDKNGCSSNLIINAP